MGFKNLGTLKGNLDREVAVVENCRVFQSSALGGGGPLRNSCPEFRRGRAARSRIALSCRKSTDLACVISCFL